MTAPCCDSHVTPVCCDPIDCGPCCERCPTCPTLHGEHLSWLTDEERRRLSNEAAQIAATFDDPRYWGTVFPPPASARSPQARRERLHEQLRWAHIAAVLGPGQYYGLPDRYYRQQHTTT